MTRSAFPGLVRAPTHISMGHFQSMQGPGGKWVPATEPAEWYTERRTIVLRTRKRIVRMSDWPYASARYRTLILCRDGTEAPVSNLHRSVGEAKAEAHDNLRDPRWRRVLVSRYDLPKSLKVRYLKPLTSVPVQP